MKLYGQSVSSTAAVLYMALCNLAEDGCVSLSRRQLGEYIGRSERTAQRVIAELKAAGLIHVKRVGLGYNDLIYINDMEG